MGIKSLSKRLMVSASLAMVGAMTASAQVPEAALQKMASAEFSVREQGYEVAKKWSLANVKTAPELLYKAWLNQEDPEVKTRCYTLMKDAVIHREFGRGKGFDRLARDLRQ